MKYTPYPHQEIARDFLAERHYALLADDPRVGKTGSSIMAADKIEAKNILIITTAAGRAVWRKGLADWSTIDRPVVLYYKERMRPLFLSGALIIGWHHINTHKSVLDTEWDVIIADEVHYSKNIESQRGEVFWEIVANNPANRVWGLSGTPMPNTALDLYPMLRFMCPSPPPQYKDLEEFKRRFCVIKKEFIRPYVTRDRAIGSKNVSELKSYFAPITLRRTQQDVGILRPEYQLWKIPVTQDIEDLYDPENKLESQVADIIFSQSENWITEDEDEVALGVMRRIAGAVKAPYLIEKVKQELHSGEVDKLVIMCWHKNTVKAFKEELSKDFNVLTLTGSSTIRNRVEAEESFRNRPDRRVIICQILAAGEAIDLSAASELLFAEQSFVPKDMAQAALRVTNLAQTKQPRVRVAVLENTIDEIQTRILVRKTKDIKEFVE